MKIIFNNNTTNSINLEDFSRTLSYEEENITDRINITCLYSQNATNYLQNLFTNVTPITSIKIINDNKQELYLLENINKTISSLTETIWSTGSNISFMIE